MTKEFIKITFQDLEIAENYFQKDKLFSEFLFAVMMYYRSKEYKIKSKTVQKYFEIYKKTLDAVIQAKEYGKKSRLQNSENHYIKSDTLQGGISDPPSTNYKLVNSNSKIENINKENKKEKPTLEEFLDFAVSKLPNVNTQNVKLKYDAWVSANWETGKGTKIKNWKSTLLNTLPYLGTQTIQTNTKGSINNNVW
jgi:hypothetical protein